MMKLINKLVRDNIPDICKGTGQIPETRILNDREYSLELRKKLQEEVQEYLLSSDIEELADILEVVEALAKDHGTSIDEVIGIKQKKQDRNGAFKKKIFLSRVEGQN